MKKGVLKNFANFTRKHLCWNLFLIKLQAFSCEIFENFKITYFEEHLRTTASFWGGNIPIHLKFLYQQFYQPDHRQSEK